MSHNVLFNLSALIEAIEKIKLYSHEFDQQQRTGKIEIQMQWEAIFCNNRSSSH